MFFLIPTKESRRTSLFMCMRMLCIFIFPPMKSHLMLQAFLLFGFHLKRLCQLLIHRERFGRHSINKLDTKKPQLMFLSCGFLYVQKIFAGSSDSLLPTLVFLYTILDECYFSRIRSQVCEYIKRDGCVYQWDNIFQ